MRPQNPSPEKENIRSLVEASEVRTEAMKGPTVNLKASLTGGYSGMKEWNSQSSPVYSPANPKSQTPEGACAPFLASPAAAM